MLKIRYLVPSCIIVLLLYSRAEGGDYHSSSATSLICSDCHNIHYTQLGTRYEAGGPWPSLLLYQTINGLCLSCHDGQSTAPDVMQTAGAGQPANRAAGAFQALSGSSTPNGHALGVS